jgi:type IV secretion system protein VirD4
MSRKKDNDKRAPSERERWGFPTDIPGRPWFGLYRGIDNSNPTEPRMSDAGPESSVMVVGPPRSGKTTSIVIPNVLDAPAAVVTTSTKADVLVATAFRRHVLGNCYVFDPTGATEVPPGTFALRWSPVVGCDSFEAAVAMAHALGAAARPGSVLTESAHWVERAESLLAPLLFAANLGGRDMASVCRWVLGRELREPLGALEASGHEMAQVVLRGVLETEDRERSGIFSTASGLLAAYRSEAALATTVNPNFDPARFACSSDTLYICAPAHAQAQLAPLVVALLEQIRTAVYARPKDAAPVVFALDEVASIAPLPSLPAIAAEGGGQGLVTLACLQDLAQARARWGEVAEGFFSLFNSKLIFPGIGDYRTLQLISALAGEEEVHTKSVNFPQRLLFVKSTQRASVTHSSTWRPRLPIDAVAQGCPGYALCLKGAAFSWLHMIPWFEQKFWRTIAGLGLPRFSEPVRPGVPRYVGPPPD